MDFNELIEKEIESRVEARCIEYKKELEEKFENYKKDLAEQYKFQMIKILNSAKDQISEYSFNTINENISKAEAQDIADTYFFNKKQSKCDFPACKNYGNGSVDNICINCDSYKIKKQKDEKCAKNLEGSAANKSNNIKTESLPKTDIKVIDLSNITSNKTDNTKYKDVIVSLLKYLNEI